MNETTVVLVDGAPTAQVPVFDRGLHFGDGLFETIACRRGRPRFLDLHCERLATGCERLSIRFEAFEALRQEVRQLAGTRELAIIKVLVTRGEATARGYAALGNERPMRVVICYEWPAENPAWWSDGIQVRVARMRLGENPALAGLKHLNRLEQILARAECDAQTQELLLFSSSGQLVSGTMTNVFIVRNNRLHTPRVDRCGVAGVMRRVVLREAARAGIAVEESVLTEADLKSADEVFVTNARVGIWPVRVVNEITYAPGAMTQRLQALIRPLLEESAA